MKQQRRPRRPRRIRQHSSSMIVLLTIACTASLISTFFVFRSNREQPISPAPQLIATDLDLIQVPTPLRSIAQGERLGAVPFTNIPWPRNRMTDAYVREVAAYATAVALTPLPKHLPVPLSAISQTTIESNEVVEGIPEGMRAITVRVDAESAVEGWARSGNFVDVIVVRASSDQTRGLESKVIAENVRILSAGQSTTPLGTGSSAPTAPNTVTLLVSQEDALKIKTAAQIGKLTFALRGKGDGAPTLTVAMNQKRLLGHNEEQVIPVNKSYRGFARDAKGRTYVLGDGERWIVAEGISTPFSSNRKENSTTF